MVFDADQVTAEVAKGIEKIQNASNLEELKAIKTTYAGADSAMTKASKAIGSLPVDQKKEAGKLMGKLRADFGRAYGPKEVELKEAAEKAALAAETVDMTLPVNRKPLGARHPLPKLMEDVEDFFISMGWQISSGPEIEAEWYNFDSLNFGPDHPARQMQDTFYVKGNQSYFPFTEPSAELDLWFPDKKGGPGWLEWGGCGMVNPNVLKSAGIDPDVYTGFAFGVGMERTLLLRSDINDMHDLVEGDVRFAEQFVMGE